MPPKQKQVKKGPTYKAATAAKDVVPATVKQPPRQARPIKIPQQFPQTQANNNESTESLFQQWPSQQALKTVDFTNGGNKFNDPFNKKIQQYIKNQTIFAWKSFEDISNLRANIPEQNESQEDDEEKFTKSLENFEFVEKKEKKQQEGNQNKEDIVIQTYMREQTPQQLERRKKEEQEKAQKAAKDKKKGKKQEPKQQGPIQVSDVKMADIVVRKSMCKEGVWIGSQLQMIKQRNLIDVYTAEPIWKKIYPQQNGVPILNKSGKYWVKLYYMGKQIKIEIDDTIPINSNVNQLFPTSQKKHEKWTLILSKALIKLIVKMGLTHEITGSGVVMYALTGMISQKIDLNQFEDWRQMENFLNDDHYTKKDIVLSCFVGNQTKSMAYPPSNIAKNPNQLKNFILLENSSSPRKPTRNRKFSDHNLQHSDIRFSLKNQFDEAIQPIMKSQIINGYAYCIGDYFSNHAFNMAFAKQKSEKEVKLRQQYNDLAKVSLTNKGREQKLDHRRKKKQIKQKLQIEEKKRLQNIGKAPIQYYFIKLLANIKINCQFSEREILLAKKCVLNKLNQPPNYDMPVQKQKDQNKSNKSIAFSKIKEQVSDTIPSVYDFSSIANVQEPMTREDQGIWIKDKDLLASFTHFQILYNPNIYQNKSVIKISGDGKMFSFDENKQILIIQKDKVQQQQKQQQVEKKMQLLFGFMWQNSTADNLYFPYTMLQKFDFESFVTTSNKVVLRDPLEATLINLPNQNNIFKIYTFAKSNYLYWISSSNKFKLLSISDYLTEYENYGKKNISIEYPPMEAGIYNNLVKLKVQQQQNEQNNGNTIILKLNEVKQQIIDYLNYRVIKVPKKDKFLYTQEQTEGVIKKVYEQLLIVYQYTPIQIDTAYEYYISIQAFPNFSLQQGTFQIVILNKNPGITIEQLEQIQPVKYVEKYQPNKYGLIFKQKLFTPIDNLVSLSIKLVEGQEGQPIQSTDKKAGKKGGKQQQTLEIIEKNMSQNRKIQVKILKNNQVIYLDRGINEINISGIKLQNTKNQDVQYSIQGSFDLKDWPQAKISSQDTNKIYWIIQVASQDTLAVVRDTTQQQRQKQIRKSWQSAQPGRSDKAKRARRKFLIETKKANGQQLTEQQLQILNAPRLTKKQQMQEDKKNQDKKGGKGGKKDDKKGAKKQEVVVEQKPAQRQPPKSKDNFMIQIKRFLHKLENCNVDTERLQEDAEQRIRSQEQIRAINEGALMAQQNRVGRLLRNIQNRQSMKIKQKDKKQQLEIFFTEKKAQFKEKWATYIQWRQQDQQKEKTKQEKEKALVDIINQEKPTISEADLKKLISDYQNIQGHNPAIADVADMVRKNIRISVITQKITNLLPAWQVEELKNIAKQIQKDKIIGIDDQVMKNMNQMLEQVERNPGIVAQKQAEAKKNKKGGKK